MYSPYSSFNLLISIVLVPVESSGVMISGTETLKAQSGFYLNKPINIFETELFKKGNICEESGRKGNKNRKYVPF